MNDQILKQELLETAWDVLEALKNDYSAYLDKYTNIIIDKYSSQIINQNYELDKPIFQKYNIKNLVDITIDDYMSNNSEVNLDEIKSNLIKLILNVILELQYKINSNKMYLNFNNIPNSYNTEDHFKIAFLKNNPKIINDLFITGTMEMLAREIGEKLDINITPEFNEEYTYILQSKRLLDNKYDLLLKGDINEIFQQLGDLYKENYFINAVNYYLKNMDSELLDKLDLSNDERNMLLHNLNIKTPNSSTYNQNSISEELKNQEKVDFISKNNTQYIKLNDEIDDEPVFAEVVGNITPEERLEKVKENNGKQKITNPNELISDVRDDMITNDEFVPTNMPVSNSQKEKIGNNSFKVDTRTGLFIGDNGKVYNIDSDDNKINELGDDGKIEGDYNMDEKLVEKLKEYSIYDLYINATPEQQKIMLETYGIVSNSDDKTLEEEKEKGIQFTKKISQLDKNGYVSSFIVVFSIGVLAGIISTILLNIAK